MDGRILQQRSSYRQGLVLGLTMAEIMILLVFCLLIGMATFLKREEGRRVVAEQELQHAQRDNAQARQVLAELRQDAALGEKLQNLSGLSDIKAIDKYWRELVDSRTVVKEIEQSGVSVKELQEGIATVTQLRANGINADKAIRDSDTVAAINRAMAKPGQPPVSTQAILDAIARGQAIASGTSGHQWPPIIRMSEADGYFFKTRSAELSTAFHDTLLNKTPLEILDYIQKYDVDVIEVVGHRRAPDRHAPAVQSRPRSALGAEEQQQRGEPDAGRQCRTWASARGRRGQRAPPKPVARPLQDHPVVRRPARQHG